MSVDYWHLLGDLSDAEIGRRHGVSAVAVGAARRRRGIAAVRRGRKPGVPYAADLGVLPDDVIAAMWGRSKAAIVAARRARGIPSPTKAGHPCGPMSDLEHGRRYGLRRGAK